MDEDTALAARGEERLGWIRSRMRLLAAVRDDFAARRPFEGLTIGVGLHTEPKTVVLLETLAAGGARVIGTGNHGSTQDDMVAALAARGIVIHGRRGDTLEQHVADLHRTLDARPDILLDNGADLAVLAIERGEAAGLRGGTEETTSGAFRLREQFGDAVRFPVIVINDSPLKAIGENLHAVGQSTVESLMRITNLQIPGRRFLVAGYGWCGRGVARYLRALGGRVAVADTDEIKALEAAFDGYRVGAVDELAPWADVIVTATGRPGVLRAEHFPALRDEVVLGNVGHFPFEIDVPALESLAIARATVADSIEQYRLPSGQAINLLAGGRMYNLAGIAPKGNSIESMDLGFTLQALSLERIAADPGSLPAGPGRPPIDVERRIARAMLAELDAAS